MTATIGGYEAEVIRLVAERGGRTPQEVVIWWFAPGARKARGKGVKIVAARYNSPDAAGGGRAIRTDETMAATTNNPRRVSSVSVRGGRGPSQPLLDSSDWMSGVTTGWDRWTADEGRAL